MKTIGLLGGMSWESTALYYSLINQGVKDRLGGLHSAKIVMYSVDFADIERMQHVVGVGAKQDLAVRDAFGRHAGETRAAGQVVQV